MGLDTASRERRIELFAGSKYGVNPIKGCESVIGWNYDLSMNPASCLLVFLGLLGREYSQDRSLQANSRNLNLFLDHDPMKAVYRKMGELGRKQH
jgi:hypothetical protein